MTARTPSNAGDQSGIRVTWDDFKALVSAYARDRIECMYRGQSKSQWGLVTSWHRLGHRGSLDAYWRLLIDVHDHIATWTDRSWDLANDEDVAAFLGYLQHHGFPTPLLDWTYSPFIAAYFAFEGVDDHDPNPADVSIFVFDHRTFASEWRQILDVRSKSEHVSILQSHSRGNKKQIIQQGVYTFQNVYDAVPYIGGLETARQANNDQPRAYLMKYVMAATEKPRVMRELRLMGVNSMMLFPGPEGVCKYLRDKYFAAERIGMTTTERTQSFFELLASLSKPHESPNSPVPAAMPLGLFDNLPSAQDAEDG